MAISFFYEKKVRLENARELRAFLVTIFKQESRPLDSLSYIFCSDEYLLGINKQFLDHDYFTDIITFDLSNKGEAAIGEVYISVDRVKENARDLNIPLNQEILRVIFHGVLHLCGYQDKTKLQKAIMRDREDFFLSKFKRQKLKKGK